MSSEYNAGVFFVAAVAGPLDVRIIDQRNGLAYPISVTSSASRLFNGPIAALTVQNLSASPIEVAADPGLTYGRGTRIPPRSQWTLAAGAISIGGSDVDTGVARPMYYDRNPLSVRLWGFQQTLAGQTGVLWTYTVPAARKAYIEVMDVMTQIATAFANDNALIENVIQAGPPGGGTLTNLLDAAIYTGVAAGTRADRFVGASIELQPTENITAWRQNGRAAGAGLASHQASAKLTEFDA